MKKEQGYDLNSDLFNIKKGWEGKLGGYPKLISQGNLWIFPQFCPGVPVFYLLQ